MATFKAFLSLKEICVILSKLPEDCKSSFESYFMHHTNDLYDNRISEARAENGDIQGFEGGHYRSSQPNVAKR